MYKLIVIIFLSWINLSWATNYYVDKNASGANNGISWTNAWESFADIGWDNLQAGDILYISGGSVSKTYNEMMVIKAKNGQVNGRITITIGIDAGHNGEVIIDEQNTRSKCVDVDRNGSGTGDYVTLKNMTFRNANGYSVVVEGLVNQYQVTGFTLENVNYLNANSIGLRIVRTDDFSLINYTFSTIFSGPKQTDALQMNYSNDFLMENSHITINNSGSSHNDGFQKNQGTGFQNGTIRNNFFDLNNTDPINSQGIFLEDAEGTWNVYNNVVDGHDDVRALVKFKTIQNGAVMNFYNNTIISGDNVVGNVVKFVSNSGSFTLNMKNNIIVATSSNATALSLNGNITLDRDYNIWWIPNASYPSEEPNGYRVDPDLNSTTFKPNSSSSPPVDNGVTLGLFNNDLDGVIRPQGSSWDIGAYEMIQGPDITPPEVTGATLLDSVTLKIMFSEPLDPVTAQNISNYSINNGITVSNATLSTNIVTLSTSPHSPGAYTVTVNNVEDLAGNPVDPTANSAQYERTADITPPEVISAILLDSITLSIIFSEGLEQSGAQNINNYSITNSIDVLTASLSGAEVTLTTSDHFPGSYTVTVSNVTDLAGNPISQSANTAEYSFIQSDSLIMFPVENVYGITQEPEHTPLKTIDGLGSFDGDPDSRWAAEPMPEELTFDLGSNKIVRKTKFSFFRWDFGRIYTYTIFKSNDNYNWVTIVPQKLSTLQEEWTIDEFPAVDARYVKIHFINNNQSDWAGIWEAEIWGTISTVVDPVNDVLPNKFSLYQNYPNPFNPSTKIKFTISDRANVVLKVFNLLGQEVAELINADMDSGVYEIDFNASVLASGVYIYRMIAGNFVDTKKMILLR